MSNEVKNTSPGTELNRLLDSMGLPDHVGDLYGAALDNAIHDDWGVARNLLDAFSGMKTNDLDKLIAGHGGMGEPGACPRPREGYDRCRQHNEDTYYDREKIQQFKLPFGNMSVFKIDGKTVDIGESMSPRAFEKKLRRDPDFREDIERKLGSRIVLDGRSDGNITLAKSAEESKPRSPNSLLRDLRDRIMGNPRNRYATMDVRDHRASTHPGGTVVRDNRPDGATVRDHRRHDIAGELGRWIHDRLGDQPINVRPFPGRGSSEVGGPGSFQPNSELSDILNDPNLPFEEKLALFCFAFMEQKQKEINEDMEKISKKKKEGEGGGFLSKAASIGGAAIGTAVGGPVGAAVGEKVGGFVGDQIEGGGSGEGEDSEQIAMMKLNQKVQAMEKMFTIVENMLKSIDDAEKQGPIAHLKG